MCAEIKETITTDKNSVDKINIGTRLILLLKTVKNPEAFARLRRIGGTLVMAGGDFLPIFGYVPPLVLVANQLKIHHIGPIEIPDLTPDVPTSPIRGAAGAANLAWAIARGIGELASAGVYPSVATDLNVWSQLIEHDGPALQRIFQAEKEAYIASRKQINEAGMVFGVDIGSNV